MTLLGITFNFVAAASAVAAGDISIGANIAATKANLDLNIGDIQASFFDADGNLVAEMTIAGGEIEASSSRTFAGSVVLSASQYAKLFAGDYFVIKVATEAGIGGVNVTLPLEASMTVVMSSVF
jgi:hypothetical protein